MELGISLLVLSPKGESHPIIADFRFYCTFATRKSEGLEAQPLDIRDYTGPIAQLVRAPDS